MPSSGGGPACAPVPRSGSVPLRPGPSPLYPMRRPPLRPPGRGMDRAPMHVRGRAPRVPPSGSGPGVPHHTVAAAWPAVQRRPRVSPRPMAAHCPRPARAHHSLRAPGSPAGTTVPFHPWPSVTVSTVGPPPPPPCQAAPCPACREGGPLSDGHVGVEFQNPAQPKRILSPVCFHLPPPPGCRHTRGVGFECHLGSAIPPRRITRYIGVR